MMKFSKYLGSLSLALLIATPVLLSGCGGGTNDQAGAELAPEEDDTLNPEDDVTMSADAGEDIIVTE